MNFFILPMTFKGHFFLANSINLFLEMHTTSQRLYMNLNSYNLREDKNLKLSKYLQECRRQSHLDNTSDDNWNVANLLHRAAFLLLIKGQVNY